ncbi:ATP-dependent universal stress protein [Aeropyrum pernix K1]|uniref:ATP-dependent universal stress protein n=1 Tax=Aeropyrum pernix (strain ATCC 700893 / DSM 11879 / JCM 9820 / NBRC 100138 / K1) TaxID=272557 RepID=Q9YFW0_AERPE|nr:universal stress protein [Aeropyrum pernix]BAA79051.2 ATP-dependent universal stress protein [Aeropyrum pernix K1]
MAKVLEHILLPLDLSEVSKPLAISVAELASRHKSRVTLLHVIEEAMVIHVAAGYDVSSLIRSIEKNAREKLDKIKKLMMEKGANVVVYEDIPVGNPGTVISEVAEEVGATEIVMGSKGLGIFRILPLGSTVRETVKISRKPVIRLKTYKENGHVKVAYSPMLFRKILVGADRNTSKSMIDYAVNAASTDDGKVILAHIIEPPLEEPSYEVKNVFKYGEKAGEERGVEVEIVVARGRPDKMLTAIASQMDASSVLVGRTVERRLSELILGSTLDRLMTLCELPLIVYPL